MRFDKRETNASAARVERVLERMLDGALRARDRGLSAAGLGGRKARYDDTRYGDARDGDADESGYRDVRWDDRDGLPPYDENYRTTTNDEVSAPRDYTPEDTPGLGNPTTSPRSLMSIGVCHDVPPSVGSVSTLPCSQMTLRRALKRPTA